MNDPSLTPATELTAPSKSVPDKKPRAKTPKKTAANGEDRKITSDKLAWFKRSKPIFVLLAGVITATGTVVGIERSREVQIRDQQATLRVAFDGFAYPKPTEQWTVKLKFLNVGKTTAYHTVGNIRVALRSASLPDPEPTFDFTGEFPTDIVTNDEIPKSQSFFGMAPDGTLGTPEKQLFNQNDMLSTVANGTGNVYIFGALQYKTEFGDLGRLKYCYRLERNLHELDQCGGDRNRSWIESKSWFGTLFSAFPFTSPGHQ